MTREDFFRAIGEVREDQIEAAETVKKQVRPWRRIGALAACLTLVITAAAVPWLNRGQPQWNSIIYNFNPGVVRETDKDSGGEDAGELDGTQYWTDNPNRPVHSDYSRDVEIGELDGPGNNSGIMSLVSDELWLSPEQLFAQDTVIFRGTVKELQYFQVEMGVFNKGSIGIKTYYTRALVEVTDSIRGDLTAGEIYSLLWLGARGYMSTSLIGPLENLDAGSDAIFMPIRTNRDTGWKEGDSYFCYGDLAELYLGEGLYHVFADTKDGLDFSRDAYPALADAETLDDVAAYIREMTGEEKRGTVGTERGYVVPVPIEPQPEPRVVPLETDPSSASEGAAPSGGGSSAETEAGRASAEAEKTGGSP